MIEKINEQNAHYKTAIKTVKPDKNNLTMLTKTELVECEGTLIKNEG